LSAAPHRPDLGSGVLHHPADASGLRPFTITLPDAAALADVVQRLNAAGVPATEAPARLMVRDLAQHAILLSVA
jgi:hypothetical protein